MPDRIEGHHPQPVSKRRRREIKAWAKLARQSERHVSKQKLKQVAKERP